MNIYLTCTVPDIGAGFPTSSDTDPIVAAVQTPQTLPQTSSAQTRSIGADGFQASAAGNGDGDEIEIEKKHVQGRNEGKGKGKGKQKLIAAFEDAQTSEPEFEKVLLPGGIGLSWCEPSVGW
jgi:hypothetical protein